MTFAIILTLSIVIVALISCLKDTEKELNQLKFINNLKK